MKPRLQVRSVPLGTEAAALYRFGFQTAGASDDPSDAPRLGVIDAPWAELWSAHGGVEQPPIDGVHITRAGSLSFLRLFQPESEGDIETAAFCAYQRLGQALGHIGHRAQRIWNYFDRINEGTGDAERYRRFCLGRYRAIEQPGFENALPAATVIGSQNPGLWIGCLAAPQAPGTIENPRQTSAYRYPKTYGPVSPSFSRAVLLDDHLLVSGTASVVGFESQHPQDVRAQATEVLRNLDALIVQASQQIDNKKDAAPWQAKALRLYLRHADDANLALPVVRQALGDDVPINVLQGEISRRELLLEIEGVWQQCG